MDDQKRRIAALATWKVYRRWAATSGRLKTRRDWGKRVIFWLTLAGTVLGPFAAHQPPLGPEWLMKIVALASGAAVGLATFFSEKILGPDSDVPWARARQAAEALKSLVYSFLMAVPPFDGANAAAALDEQRNKIETAEPISSLIALPIDDTDSGRGFPPFPITTEDYAMLRAAAQKKWFDANVRKNHDAAARFDGASKFLGAAGALLAATPALGLGASGWIAVISSVAASLASRVTVGRYRYLEKSYYDASARLGRILDRWEGSDKTEADGRQLVLDCERVLQKEDAAWVESVLDTAGPPTLAPAKAAAKAASTADA